MSMRAPTIGGGAYHLPGKRGCPGWRRGSKGFSKHPRGKRTLFGRTAALSQSEARAKDNHLVIQPTVEPILSNLHPGAEGPACAEFFDSITDGLSRCRETPVIGVSSSRPRQIEFCR
jgi:hypothetical protein